MKHDEKQHTFDHVAAQLHKLTALLTEYNSAVCVLRDHARSPFFAKRCLSKCIQLWERVRELEIGRLTQSVRQLLEQIECPSDDAKQVLWILEGFCAYNDRLPAAVRSVSNLWVSGTQYCQFCDEWSAIWDPRRKLLQELPERFTRPALSVIFCPICGSSTPEGFLFCPCCGSRMPNQSESGSGELELPPDRMSCSIRKKSALMETLDRDLRLMEDDLQCLNQQTADAKRALDSLRNEIALRNKDLDQLLAQSAHMRDELACLQHENTEMEARNRELEEAVAREAKRSDLIRQELASLQCANCDMKAENRRLELAVAQEDERSAHMRQELACLQHENTEMEARNRELELAVAQEEERSRLLREAWHRQQRQLEELRQINEACLETNLNMRRMERPEPSPSLEIARVFFSALAPKRMSRGVCSMIHVVMYEEAFRSVVERMIAEADDPLSETSKGAKRIREASRIRIVLTSQDIPIEDNVEEEIWEGAYLQFQFAVTLPADYEKDRVLFHASVYINDLLSSTLKFTASCSASQPQRLQIHRRDIMSAFISYAHQDRKQVATLVMGIKKVRPDMDIFFDITALRSGDRWEPKLKAEIEQRDILYLCWSRNARASQWVDREWRYALALKGPDGIEPLPLDSPDKCPPPEELQHMHFHDNLLFVINAN